MKCKSCKDKPLFRGVKLIECVSCKNSRLVGYNDEARICNACSEKHGQCVTCGKMIKFDK